jgi:hypothetical protein
MTSKNKLLLIGKLSIATLLFLATYMKVAKAAIDPAAPTDMYAVMAPNGQYIQINWIDNTLNESNFQVTIYPLANQGNPQTYNAAAASGRGTRTLVNLGGLPPGAYKYRVCVQRPGILTCNPTTPSFNIPQAANPNPPANFPAPTNVSATRVGASTERIFWNHPGGAGSFRVYIRLPGNNNWTQSATVGGNERRADIGPLFINTNYPVAVCGRSPAGQDKCSPTINVVLPQGF